MVEMESAPVPVVSFKNVLEVIAEVQLYHEQARLIVAGRLLAGVDRYLESGQHAGTAEVKTALALLGGELKASFDELRHRAAECSSTLDDWHAPDWLVAQTFMGVTTFYKLDPDGSLWIKMHGTMDDVGIMDQLATVREVDLFKKWVPFCNTSKLLTRLGVVELIAYFSLSLPGVRRDCVLHAYGCDSVMEDSCILIQGQSVEEVPEGVEVPEFKGWRNGRMDVKAFKAKIEILSPTSARTSIVANVDPNAPVPQALVNFVVRKMAGMFLYCLKQAAKPISTDESNCHRRRIEEDQGFYKDWLLPRFERFYRQKGWAIGDDLAAAGATSARGSLNPSNKTKKSKSSRSCSPFGRKPGPRVKRALKRLKFTRRRDQPPADVHAPQVETLGIDDRLLEKWQTRKDNRRGVRARAWLYLSMDSFDGDQAFISDGSSPGASAAEIPTALLNDMDAISLDQDSSPSSTLTIPEPAAAAAAAAAAVGAQSERLSPGRLARDQMQGERTPDGATSEADTGAAAAAAAAAAVRGGDEEQEEQRETRTEEPSAANTERETVEEEDDDEDYDDDDDDDDDEFEWGAAKHIFVLSSAGKPVFSLQGDEQRLSTLMSLIQALLSMCADCDDGDEMESISAGSRRFVFLKRGNLVLVAVSSLGTGMLGDDERDEGSGAGVRGEKDEPECESFMRLQLEYLYASILFLLTSKVQGIFLRSPGYDLRGLLGGADTSLRGIIELAEPSRGRGRMLASGVETVWMDPAIRLRVARALQSAQAASAMSGALYAIWVCGEKLVSLAQPRAPSHRLTSRDLLLLVNFVATQPALRTAESWTPVCFPRFQETGYLYAYIAFLEDPASAPPPLENTNQKPSSSDSSSSAEKNSRAGGADGSRDAQGDSNGDRTSKKKGLPTGGEAGAGGDSCVILVSVENSSEQFEAFRRTRTALESRFRSSLGTYWDRYLGAGAAVEREGILTKFCTQMQALHFYYCLRGKHGGAPCVTQCLSSPFVDPKFAKDPSAQRRVWDYYTRAALRLRRGSCQEGRVFCRRGDSSSSRADWIFNGAGGGGGGVQRSREARDGGDREGGEGGENSEQDLATALFESDPEHSLVYEIGENVTVMSLFGQREDGAGGGGRWTSSSSGGGVGTWGNRDELHACFPSSVPPEAAYKAAVRLAAIVRRDWEWLFVTGTGSAK
eukprot:g8357.t1